MKAAAILDTGADETTFPTRFATILGFDLTTKKKFSARTAGGDSISIEHDVVLTAFADGLEIQFPNDQVRFMDGLHIPILGVRTFLRYFKVTFDYYEGEFILEANEHAKALKFLNLSSPDIHVDEISYGKPTM